jgi:transcriptional regulator with XRE-family HTH domain
LLGLSPSAYSRIERGETSVTFDKLPTFAEALQVPIQDLLPETVSITSNHNSNSGHGYGLIMDNLIINANKDDLVKELETENLVLKEKNNSLQNEISLLKDMIEVLKGK